MAGSECEMGWPSEVRLYGAGFMLLMPLGRI